MASRSSSGQLYISEQDPTTIVNIIDWQFTSIMPAFMQIQWPHFITTPDNYKIGLVKPELPPNFETMDSDEKSYALTERNRALLSKCYEAALAKNHLPSYLAFTNVDSDELFSLCETTTRDGIVPLRDSLIQISEKWSEMGSGDYESFPYLVTDDGLTKHELELAEYKDWQTLKGYTQELLQSDQMTMVGFPLNLTLTRFLKDTTSCIDFIWNEKRKSYQKRM